MIVIKINKQTNEVEIQASTALEEFTDTDRYEYKLYPQEKIPQGKYHLFDGADVIADVNKNTLDRKKSDIIVAQKYLTSTDWYYARQLETGEEVPADVVTKRLEARAYIREVEDGK